MKETSTKKKPLNFSQYRAPNLSLNVARRGGYGSYISCGSAALSMLMNIHPFEIDKDCPNPFRGWFTSRLVKYLREKGFIAIELSKDMVLNTAWHDFSLTSEHCLLINCRVDQKENSLVIVHSNEIWHNFRKEELSPLYFINKPTQDVILVFHRKWGPKKKWKSIKLK